MAATRGIKQRIKAGWSFGLSQRDGVVWVGTLLIVAQLILIPYMGWKRLTSSQAFSALSGEAKPTTEGSTRASGNVRATVKSRSPAVGVDGWTYGAAAALYPGPKYSREQRVVFDYTPVHVLGRSADGQWLQVRARLLSGETLTGYVLVEAVQSTDPAAGARSETGWVVVTRDGGAPLKAAPSLNAAGYGAAPKGRVLKVTGRLKLPDFMPGVSGDFLRVEGGSHGTAWVFANHTSPSVPQAGASQ